MLIESGVSNLVTSYLDSAEMEGRGARYARVGRLWPVRLGSVRFGSVRFGSIWFGLV